MTASQSIGHTWTMRSLAATAALVLALAACTAPAADEVVVNEAMVSAASDICPILWQWQLGVGGVMNEMSHAAFHETDPEERKTLYLRAIEDARQEAEALRTKLAALPAERFRSFFVSEIRKGLDAAEQTINHTEAEVHRIYNTVTPTYHEIVPTIFLSFEKVIDLPKPELGTYGDPLLIPSFQEIPQCQHGVKDADDGEARYIPLN